MSNALEMQPKAVPGPNGEEPNHHAVLFEATNAYSGQRYRALLVPQISGDAEAAQAMLEQARAPLAPGTFRDPAMSDFVVIGLISMWVDPASPQFAPAPLSGPEWEQAWNKGPGAEA